MGRQSRGAVKATHRSGDCFAFLRSFALPHQSPSNTLRCTFEGTERQMNIPLECVVHQTSKTPKQVIFALHGFGDNARNFADLASELVLPDTLWIVLQAPEALPFQADGAQWYELFGNPHPQLRSSYEKVRNTMETVQAQLGIPWSKCLMFGFSQGAFVSLYSAIMLPHDLAGVVALSGYLGQSHKLRLPHEGRKKLPVFLAHGLNDQVVFPAQHFETLDILQHLGFTKVTAKTYKGVAHSLCAEELFDIKSFIGELT
ncbi:MAG: hypothetical protein EBR09_10260 [Proteobacteria bacterium]|nr:hypothetical protein [Pseudomonadota bacterium]